MEKEEVKDYIFRVHLYGNSGTGKTSIMNRVCGGTFDERYIPTIGIDFYFKNYDASK